MSKFIILLLVIYGAISPAYAQATLSEADKAAIVAVIEQETRCYSNNDYDGWLTCWSQHPESSAFVATGGAVYERVSWKVWSDGVMGDMRNRTGPDPVTTRRENIGFIVLGTEEVMCHFDAYSIRGQECSYTKEIRALRKEAGRWKLCFMTAMADSNRKCGE